MNLRHFFVPPFILLMAPLAPIAAQSTDKTVELDSTSHHPVLIQLFTSEGCSSCPPAENWLSQYAGQSTLWTDVVPVAFHVDYWDNLGWPDRFASPTYTDRQRRYASIWRSDSVYTPGMTLNGREWREWSSVTPGSAIPAPDNSSTPGTLHVTISPDATRTAKVTYSGTLNDGDTIHVAWLGIHVVSDVRSGENAGSRLTHDFVVVDYESANSAKSFRGTNERRPAVPMAIAVWVEDSKGRTIQAVGGSI